MAVIIILTSKLKVFRSKRSTIKKKNTLNLRKHSESSQLSTKTWLISFMIQILENRTTLDEIILLIFGHNRALTLLVCGA